MSLIKFCGFTQEKDIAYAQSLGVQYYGFVFYASSPRFIAPTQACALAQNLSEQNQQTPVGLFVNHSAAQVKQAAADSGVRVLQFHGTETPAFCEAMSQQLGLPYWKAVHVAANTQPDALVKSCLAYSSAKALVFDTASPGLINAWGGTGHTFEWQKLAPLAALSNVPPLVLSGGLNVQNVAQGIAQLKPWAVDVSSGIEAQDTAGKPLKGIKDPAKMAAFMAAARSI